LAACLVLTCVSQLFFWAKAQPLIALAAAQAGVPMFMLQSFQYMGIVSATSVWLVVWLVASAMLVAIDILTADTTGLVRLFELNALAFYSQVPWLVAVVVLAWVYEPLSSELATGGAATGVSLERLTRLLRDDPTLVAVRTFGECSSLWLHGLFGICYHVLSKVPLPRALLVALAVYGLPHLVGAVL
jgi:hypothetical protein